MWRDAFAQAPGGQAGADPLISNLLQFMPLILMFAIIYFLMIRPQQENQRKLKEMVKALKKGDRVLTSGGIYGTVLGVDDVKAVLKIADDTKVEFAKSAIVQVLVEEAK
jgi:preprotein translocase subunit YajC